MKKNIKNFCEGIYKKIADLKAPTVGEYILWFLLLLFPFISLMDGDTKAFVHYEVDFWESIFKGGGIRNFYEYTNDMINYYKENNIAGAYPVIYDFPVYLVLGIWGFPLWLICSTFGIEETSTMWTMVYGKSIFFVGLAVTAYLIYKICRNLDINKVQSKWASFLFLSSALVFVDIGIMGQLDVLGFPFTLLGIYYYQKKCDWKFIFFFAIAVTFKQFPLFVFVPLLVLREKNILKIIGKIGIVVGTTILVGLPFPKNTEAMHIKSEIRDQFIDAFLGVKIPMYDSTVPIIVILIGAICIYCYLKKLESQEELLYFSIFIPALTMFVLMISFYTNPYWLIHIAPFFAILIIYNSRKYNLLIMFETIGILCLTINQFGAYYWCFKPQAGKGMLLDKLFGYPEQFFTMQTFAAYLRLDRFAGVFFAGFVLCMATVLYLSRPNNCEKDEKVVIRKYALLRLILNAGISYMPALLYLVSCWLNAIGYDRFFR